MSEHMGIPSFIQNVNCLAQNMHLLQLSEGLLTPETVKALKVATGLPFSEIIKDISKGVTPEGRRKIDISYAEVPDQGSDYAHYTTITITGSLDNFSYTHVVDSVGVHELYDVREAIKDAIDAYNGAASAMGLSPIENYVVEVHYPENPCKRPVIRIRDDDPEAAHTFLSSITLHTESGIDLTTNWNDTTSALLSLGANQSQIYTVMAATEGFASDASISASEAEASAAETKASANLIKSLGYIFLGEYAAGVELTEYNQIVRDGSGEFWRISGQVDLPYVSAGTGMPEGGAFVSVGDAVLRQDLANPDKGAAMVARGVVAVDSISDLLALPEGQRKERLRYLVKDYHAGSGVGGGEFIWDVSLEAENDFGYVLNGFVRSARGPVTPEQFGALGDGTSDDTDGLRRAIAKATGAELVLSGHYRVTEELNLSDIKISGTGSVTKAVGSNQRLFNVGSNVTVDGITLYSTGAPVNANGIIYLLEAAKGIKFIACSFIDTGNTYCAITASITTSGPLYETNVEDVLINNCFFRGFSRPMYLASIDYFTFTGNTVEDCRFDAIRTRKNMEFILVQGNTFRRIGANSPPDNQTRDVLDTKWAGRSLIFSDNLIDGCESVGVDIKGSSEGEPNEDSGPDATSRRIIIANNIFKDVRGSSVSVKGAHPAIEIGGNIIQTTASSDPAVSGIYAEGSYVNIHHNQLIDCGRGIMIGSGAQGHASVESNYFVNSTAVDLFIDGSDATVNVVGNSFSGFDPRLPSRRDSSAPALHVFNQPGKHVSFDSNTFSKPGGSVFIGDVSSFLNIRRWTNNRIVEGQIGGSDARIYRDATVFHSDRGHTEGREEANLANYNVGDTIFRYGVTNAVMIVGLDDGVVIGTASAARHSRTITAESGFDFGSLVKDDWVTLSGVRGCYQVVDIDPVALTFSVDVALERNAETVSVIKRQKKLFSVDLHGID